MPPVSDVFVRGVARLAGLADLSISPVDAARDILRERSRLSGEEAVAAAWHLPPMVPDLEAVESGDGGATHLLSLLDRCARLHGALVALGGESRVAVPPVFRDLDTLAESLGRKPLCDAGIFAAILGLQKEGWWYPGPSAERVGRFFHLDPEVVQRMALVSGNVDLSWPTPEDLYRLFHEYDSRPEDLSRLTDFMSLGWERRYQQSVQSWLEVLGEAVVSQAWYRFLDARKWKLSGGIDGELDLTRPLLLASARIGDSGYFLGVSPGSYETEAGFEFQLMPEKGEFLAKIGVILGDRQVTVVNVQGSGRVYHRLRPELVGLLAGQDPLDWLIEGVAQWARAQTFQKMRGYHWRLNYWIRDHLKSGLFLPREMPRFERVYNKRFERLGMKPIDPADPPLSLIFQRDLAAGSGGLDEGAGVELQRDCFSGLRLIRAGLTFAPFAF